MSFTPAQHGFHFSNREIEWAILMPAPIPFVTHVSKHKQLCGGMVYAALDYFLGGRTIPSDKEPPPLQTPLSTYIIQRQGAAHPGTDLRFGMRWTPLGLPLMIEEADDEILKLRRCLSVSPIPICIVRNMSGHHLLALGVRGDASNVTIKAYDPGVPDLTCTITGNARDGYINNSNDDKFLGFFVDDSYSRRTPLDTPEPDVDTGVEGDWRWCHACQAVFFEGGVHNGACPKGGWHKPGGVKRYLLKRNGGPGESGWKWCRNCQGLFWPSGGNTGVCPGANVRGGGHNDSDAWVYSIRTSVPSGDHFEAGWRYCRGCRLLYHSDEPGACAASSTGAGGVHNRDSPTSYWLEYS